MCVRVCVCVFGLFVCLSGLSFGGWVGWPFVGMFVLLDCAGGVFYVCKVGWLLGWLMGRVFICGWSSSCVCLFMWVLCLFVCVC